jgi:uncharacterized protein (TIGR02117 family)
MVIRTERIPILRDGPIGICVRRRRIIDMLKFSHGGWLRLKLFRINSIGAALRAVVAWPLLVLGIYMAAALVGSAIPANHHWQPHRGESAIYLHDNGIHLSIILPHDAAGNTIDQTFPETAGAHAAFRIFGWGDKEFYRNTPTWGDISLRTAAAALLGSGQSLLHVEDTSSLPSGAVRVAVSEEEMQHIANRIIATAPNAAPLPGYHANDLFYPAKGHGYSALYTCNNWTSDILASAGIKTGYWTPLPFGVMWWVD